MKNHLLIFLCIISMAARAQNNALSFTGANYVSIPDVNALDLTVNYTIEAWIKPTSFGPFIGIVSKYHSPSANGMTLRTTGTGNYRGILFNNFATADNILTANVWQHVAAVKSGSTYTVYINGIAYPTTGTPFTEAANSDVLAIGVDYLTTPRYFIGQMDEVRIWNTARTQQQIKTNMFKAIGAATTGLVAYYNFNEGTSTTLGNSCTNTTGINGSLISSPVWIASPVQQGNNALNFDGVNDYVVIGNALSTNASYTKEAWIYMTTSPTYGNVISSTNSPFYFGSTTLYAGQAGSFSLVSTAGFALNTWTHIAVTFDDPGNTMKLYKNGVLVNSNTSVTSSYTTENMTIGAHESVANSWTSNFPGNIDEVRIWNVARTQAQILASMNTELDPATQTGLVAYYTFNQGIIAGTNGGIATVTDLAGNFNGVMNNFAGTGTTSNFVAQNGILAALPLQWRSFMATKQYDNVWLQWSTAAEQNTSSFFVQHSTDGASWQNIGQLNAAGNSSQTREYSFIDAVPGKGNNFYRILQTDMDGKNSYSAVRKITGDAKTDNIVVMGNPVKNDALSILVNEVQSVSLLNAEGRLCWQNQLAKGMQQIDVRHLPTGMYVVKTANMATKVIISRQ